MDNNNQTTYQFTTSQKIYLPFKRLIGIFGSVVGIVVCFVLLWWWVIPVNAIVTKGHPFFVHKRLGKDKKVFGLIKFRSMKLDANPNRAPSSMNAEEQKSMETGFGKFLRKTSIDETPQLLNIFVGQMAFIGPRPGAATNEEGLIAERDSFFPCAYEVKPGISGLAQVKMKRGHNPKLKASYDSEYIKTISLLNDIKLFFTTLFKMFVGAR
ncbi:MAG: sugar transferase [Erysipelotrichaceae bacterium]|nr:sugar transferase [Erysipelotrichaceae bacterium]